MAYQFGRIVVHLEDLHVQTRGEVVREDGRVALVAQRADHTVWCRQFLSAHNHDEHAQIQKYKFTQNAVYWDERTTYILKQTLSEITHLHAVDELGGPVDHELGVVVDAVEVVSPSRVGGARHLQEHRSGLLQGVVHLNKGSNMCTNQLCFTTLCMWKKYTHLHEAQSDFDAVAFHGRLHVALEPRSHLRQALECAS